MEHTKKLPLSENDLIRIAKRLNNNRRPYLLVNPLQAKHIPVSPSKALQMMTSLGELVSSKYSDSRLVIGFAETATAIGAVVAKELSDECIFLHTTREIVENANGYIQFFEEHSHATEQKIVADNLDYYFSQTNTIVFVDDEFTTGKTLINMINCLKEHCPSIAGKRIVAASIINRLSNDNLTRWSKEGIETVCLLQLDNNDYSSTVNFIKATDIAECKNEIDNTSLFDSVFNHRLPDPRLGVRISDYYSSCEEIIGMIEENCSLHGKDILVLGTEECMLPALLIGRSIEEVNEANSINCHSTTRSPIGISDSSNYPIRSGFRLRSFYDSQRESYIYNIRAYDIVIIVSDAKNTFYRGLLDLKNVLLSLGCHQILCIAGNNDD